VQIDEEVAPFRRESRCQIVGVYGPAVPTTPKISLAGIVRDATRYPAHPRPPDFSRVNPARRCSR